MTAHRARLKTLRRAISHGELVGILRMMWLRAGVRPWHVLLSLTLALLVSLAEGGSFAFLIPLSDGVAAGSFTFLEESPKFGWITRLVPEAGLSPTQRDLALAVVLLALLLLGRLLKVFFEISQKWWVTERDKRYQTRVGSETFRRLTSFGRLYFQRRPLGHIDAELTWAASPIQVLSQLESLTMYVGRLVVKLAVVMAISIHLFSALVLSLAVLAAITHLVSRRAASLADHSAWIHKLIRKETLDTLANISLIKALNQESVAEREYAERLGQVESVRAEIRRMGLLKSGVVEATVLVSALVGEGLILIFVPGTPAEHLTRFCAFFLVAQQSLPDLQQLSAYILILVDQVPRLRALARLYEDEAKFTVPSGSRPFPSPKRGIEIRNLRFAYEDALVLQDLHATVPAGRVTALVGASGSGKTTVADLLVRLYDCAPQTIFFDGVDVREFDLTSFRRRTFIVGHDPWILSRTLRENLAFGLETSPEDEALWAVLRAVELAAYVSTLSAGLDTELGDNGVTLSEGQRQRVALARVLLRDLDLLVLDEATSALDGGLEERIMARVMERLAGHTVLIISHRLSTVRLADQILVMESGRVVEAGTCDELAAAGGHFHELFGSQMEASSRVPGV